MFALAVICVALSIVDGCAAIYFSMTDRVSVAWLLLANFVVLGALIMFRVFG